MRHMTMRHPRRNRIVPPPGFVELHLRSQVVGPHQAAVAEMLLTHFQEPGAVGSGTRLPGTVSGVTAELPGDTDGRHFEAIGFGVFSIPEHGYVRGSLPVRRPRSIFQTSTAARIRAYYEAMPEASRTRRLVPPSVGRRPSLFNTPLLREALKFALCAGGAGLSQADQRWYVSLLLMAEESGSTTRYRGARQHKRRRVSPFDAEVDGAPLVEGTSQTGARSDVGSEDGEAGGEIVRAFGSKDAFVAAVRGEQRRVLSKLCWDVTPLDVEGVAYLFYSRDLLFVCLDLLRDASHLQLWGERLGLGRDGTRLRSDMLDSDVFLTEEMHVRARHGALSFVLAVQLFVDEAVVSWSGAHYMYPIRARLLNVRDRSVQWVTVGHVPHVGKPVARTSAARRRASDARNGVLQRCLEILLRHFVDASQTGVAVEFPGRQTLTAVPRLVGLVADQLGERSVMCLMGNACEFFCSHCVVRRDVAGGPAGVGAPARDVTVVLDAQLHGSMTRDQDPRPSLRNQLKNEHSALAFVPAIGAIWGLATDSKQLYNIISLDLLHVWKLGVVRMVAQRFPSFLRVACAGQDARLGPVGDTLEAVNLRAWEMGHLNVPSPTPPG